VTLAVLMVRDLPYGPMQPAGGSNTPTLEVTDMADTLTMAELDQHEVSLLEPRETLAFLNFANVSATNLALALNAATIQSQANAWAGQAVIVVQG
jgi:hypothetical protein